MSLDSRWRDIAIDAGDVTLYIMGYRLRNSVQPADTNGISLRVGRSTNLETRTELVHGLNIDVKQ